MADLHAPCAHIARARCSPYMYTCDGATCLYPNNKVFRSYRRQTCREQIMKMLGDVKYCILVTDDRVATEMCWIQGTINVFNMGLRCVVLVYINRCSVRRCSCYTLLQVYRPSLADKYVSLYRRGMWDLYVFRWGWMEWTNYCLELLTVWMKYAIHCFEETIFFPFLLYRMY